MLAEAVDAALVRFGLLAVTNAVLPVLRRQRGGHLVALSSMGGFAAGAGFGPYVTDRAAAFTKPWPRNKYDGEIDGHDPAWGVAEIRRAVADPASGRRLPLGSDAIGRIGAKLAAVRAQLDAVRT